MQSEQDAREIAERLRRTDSRAAIKWLRGGPFTDRARIQAAGLFSSSRAHRYGNPALWYTKHEMNDLGRSVASHLQRKSPS